MHAIYDIGCPFVGPAQLLIFRGVIIYKITAIAFTITFAALDLQGNLCHRLEEPIMEILYWAKRCSRVRL